MSDDVVVLHGRTVLVFDAEGPPIDSGQGALDVIGAAWEHQADLVAIPVDRIGDNFFDLSSGVAGEVLQKFVNYRLQVAVVGSITARADRSAALRAFVGESNRGQDVWFLDDLGQLDDRLAPSG